MIYEFTDNIRRFTVAAEILRLTAVDFMFCDIYVRLPVTLMPNLSNSVFRGFLIQSRLLSDDVTVVGSFIPPSSGEEYKLLTCSSAQVSSVIISA